MLVAEKDTNALAHALVSAAENPDSLCRMGLAAAEAVRRDFDQTNQVRRLEDIYLRTI
jgi:glycosyltransferase involved in cell wall biosynthesis